MSDVEAACFSKLLVVLLLVESYDELQILGRRVDETLRRIMSQAEELIPKIEDVQAEKMGDMVDEEMLQTTKAIEQATAKLAVSSSVEFKQLKVFKRTQKSHIMAE